VARPTLRAEEPSSSSDYRVTHPPTWNGRRLSALTVTGTTSNDSSTQSSGCDHEKTKVVDSRPSVARHVLVRRRRECLACGVRFTTLEVTALDMKTVKDYEFELWLNRRIEDAGAKRTHSPVR
jgi:hypothetical protein